MRLVTRVLHTFMCASCPLCASNICASSKDTVACILSPEGRRNSKLVTEPSFRIRDYGSIFKVLESFKQLRAEARSA